jgi:hypothetical protein
MAPLAILDFEIRYLGFDRSLARHVEMIDILCDDWLILDQRLNSY